MGDRSSGWINIHGVFPAERLDELLQQIEDFNAGSDIGEPFKDRIEARTYIEAAAANPANKGLMLAATEMNGGDFWELQEKLIAWHVAYWVEWHQGDTYAAGTKRYDPATDESLVCWAIEDFGPVATLNDLREALAAGTIAELIERLSWVHGGEGVLPFEIQGALTRAAEAHAEVTTVVTKRENTDA